MRFLYPSTHFSIFPIVRGIILVTILPIWVFPSAADCCSIVHAFDIAQEPQLCLVENSIDFPDDIDDEARQEYYYMFGNYLRQTTRSLRLSSTPLRSSVPSSALRTLTAPHTPTPSLKRNNSDMASSSSSSSLPGEPSSEPTKQQQQQHESDENSNGQKLALPAVPQEGSTPKIDISGKEGTTTVSLDHLGPIVVNQDGTMSRISNWDKMTEIEQKNTLRIIGKRNKQRLEALKAAGVGESGEGSL